MRPALLLLVPLLPAAVTTPAARAAGQSPPPPFVAGDAGWREAFRDAVVEDLGSRFTVVAPPQPAVAADVRYRWRFPRAVFVYAPRRNADGISGIARVVTIHHLPEDADAAHRTARLCARLLRLHREHFGRDAVFPRGSGEADVWLSRDTPPAAESVGGETRDNQVYVFSTGAPRTPIEWVRTVVHEWGHLTLPAARGFRAPENDAGGFLGERLYLKWLREETLAGKVLAGKVLAAEEGADASALNTYYTRQIAPLIARFQSVGPDAPGLEAMDAGAMDLYVGAALASDDALGSFILGRGLFAVLDVRPRGLFDALRQVAAGSPVLAVRLPAWIPLLRTTYRITPGDGAAAGAVAFADRPPLAFPSGAGTELRVRLPGWKWVRAASGNVRTITLRRVRRSEAAGS